MTRDRRSASLARAGVAIGALAVTGCATDQAADVRAYRDLIQLPGADGPHRDTGEPLSLEQAIHLANAQNERLSIEGERYVQALAARQRSASALMPTVDLFGALIVRENTGSGSGDSGSRNTVFDAGIGGQYTVLTGMSDFATVRAGDATIEQRRWAVLDLRETLLLETARAYYAVLRAERLVEVLESSMAVQDERLRDIRGRQSVGFARPLDVAQIEAQASQTRVSVLDARNEVARARAALSLLTGAETAGAPLTDGFDPPEDQPTADDLDALAASHRQDLRAAIAAAEAARAEVDAEIGRYYPTITVNLDYFLTRETVPTDRDWTSLLTVNVPVFTAGRIGADVRAAWSRFRESVLNHSLTRRTIRRDVEAAHADLVASRLRVVELERQVSAANEALRQAEAAFAAGLGTNLERISAQDAQLSAELGLASERFVLKVTYLAAMRAAGVLTPGVTARRIPPAPELPEAPRSPFVTMPHPGGGTHATAG